MLGLMRGQNARSEIILDGGGEMFFRIARTGEGKPILLCTLTILNSPFKRSAKLNRGVVPECTNPDFFDGNWNLNS